MIEDNRPFRPCVGILLLNKQGQVFVGARNDISSDHWQMPQGGIDEGEEPREAVFREMEEEIGTRNAEILAEHPDWIYYRLPPELAQNAWKGQYQGQMQRWFAFRFLGSDDEINIATKHPEFRDWKWANLETIPAQTIEFKRSAYEEIREAFRDVAERLNNKGL
jgi:putative (di)nucleoside polyphosphate hydrolase